MQKAEILAPAGNIESLKTAVLCGADAVYFGLSEFNARMRADNFNFENLSDWVDFCHLYGVRVYITLNTVIKNLELNKLDEFIYKAATSNVDAFIVTDIATIEACKRICPDIPLHFSTQFGIHNLEGAKIAVALGAKRIILARETPISEIKRIKENLDVEIEAFAHGAMCVSFSGRCYLSSFIDGNSGNRGRCKQPCRLKYQNSLTKEQGYYLSMKDLCLAERIKELESCGVCSFKIEGRLKSPQYVGSAVTAYKRALLGLIDDEDISNLQSTYSRIFTNKGYLYGAKHNLITSKIQNNAGLEVGRVEKVQKLRNGLNKVYFSSSRELFKGDGLKIINHGQEICGAELTSKQKENGYYVLYTSKTPENYSVVSLTFNSAILSKFTKRRINITFDFKEKRQGEYLLTVKDNENFAQVNLLLEEIQYANTPQVDSIKSVLSKENQPFIPNSINVDIITDTFIPRSLLNKARKDVLELLAKKRIEKFNKSNIKNSNFSKIDLQSKSKGDGKNGIACIISSSSALTESLLNYADKIIYAPYDFNDHELSDVIKIVSNRAEIYFGIPDVCFENDIKVLYKTIKKYNTCIKGIYGNSIFCKEIAQKYDLDFFGGFGLNITNNISASFFKNKVLSLELNKEEINKIDSNAYVYVYGYPSLMTFVYCPNYVIGKNCSDCSFDKGEVSYSDKGRKYNIKRTKIGQNCYFSLHQDIPISLSEFSRDFKNIILDLSQERDINLVINSFKNNKKIDNSTTAHFLKGVL